MLGLIHNIRIDRERKNTHSFKKSLNNYSTSDLIETDHSDDQILSSNWLDIYRS